MSWTLGKILRTELTVTRESHKNPVAVRTSQKRRLNFDSVCLTFPPKRNLSNIHDNLFDSTLKRASEILDPFTRFQTMRTEPPTSRESQLPCFAPCSRAIRARPSTTASITFNDDNSAPPLALDASLAPYSAECVFLYRTRRASLLISSLAFLSSSPATNLTPSSSLLVHPSTCSSDHSFCFLLNCRFSTL